MREGLQPTSRIPRVGHFSQFLISFCLASRLYYVGMSKSRMIRFARYLRQNETVAEQVLWAELRGRRLDGWKFRRQAVIEGYIVDFLCHSGKLTIELDGIVHDGQEEADLARRRALESVGFLEIRFTNQQVAERLDWVLHEIRRTLALATGRPVPDALFRWGINDGD